MAQEEEEGDAVPKQHTHSYCCLDYPAIVDVVQVSIAFCLIYA